MRNHIKTDANMPGKRINKLKPTKLKSMKPPVKPAAPQTHKQIEAKSEGQQRLIDAIHRRDVVFCVGPAGSGKAQPLTATVWTPLGPKKMGELSVGDEVCTPKGGIAKIKALFPQGVKQVYKITFNNGDVVESCLEHLWKVRKPGYWSSKGPEKIVNTEYLLNNFKSANGRRLLFIDVPESCYFEEKDVLLDPYIMGYLIGNGSLTVNCVFSTSDTEVLKRFEKTLLPNHHIVEIPDSVDYGIRRSDNTSKNQYSEILKHYGLLGHKSIEKFIPQDYLFNSIEKRWELLRGLMDSDGFHSESTTEFSTSSQALAKNVKTLVESLGGVVSVSERLAHYTYNGKKIRSQNISYRLYVKFEDISNAFWLNRKKEKCHERTKYHVQRIIENVEYSHDTECQCILLDDEDHMYLTDNFVPTHNTFLAVGVAVKLLRANQVERIVLCRPMVGAGEDSGALPGDQKEKLSPYLRPLYDELKYFTSYSELAEWENKRPEILEIAPLQFMRGRTFKNCIVILDEAQNATLEQIRMFLTRIGEGSKLIINGDLAQTDLNKWKRGGLRHCVERFVRMENEGLEIVHLHMIDVVRHHLIPKMMDRLSDLEE